MKKFWLAPLLAAALVGCSSYQPQPAPLSLDYATLGKINLSVQSVQVTDRSMPQNAQMAVLGNMHPTLAEAMHRWVDGRIAAVGPAGQAMFIIKDANITVQQLPTESGFDSWFKRQQASKYVGHISIDAEAHGANGDYSLASAEAQRSVSVPENPTEAERQKAYDELVEGLMKDLNTHLEQSIREHMQNFVVTAPVMPNGAPVDAPVQPAVQVSP
jgi:hypothetical protein